MKLVAVLLLSLAALAWSDTSYQNYQTYQNYRDQTSLASSNYYEQQGHHDQTGLASSNYYEHPRQPVRRTGGGIAVFLQRVLSPVRRQGFGGLGSLVPGNFIVFLFACGLIIIVIIGVGYYAATYNSSGRGLDTDEWEVDHSVWMDQLQEDFEDSWAEK